MNSGFFQTKNFWHLFGKEKNVKYCFRTDPLEEKKGRAEKVGLVAKKQ